MKTWNLALLTLGVSIAGCSKPAQTPRPAISSTIAPSITPAPPTTAAPSAPSPVLTKDASMAVPDVVRTEAYDYYGLGVTKPQKIEMTVAQPDEKGNDTKKVYSGVRTITVGSVSEGTADFVEVETGSPNGDVSQTSSASKEGLFLEAVDPGKLKSVHQMLLPADPAPGTTWKAHLVLDLASKTLDENVTYRIAGVQQIQTKSGKQTALYVSDDGTGTFGGQPYTQKEEWWYVKGVGPVRNVNSEMIGGKKYSQEVEIVG